MTSASTSLESMWKNRGLMPKDICVLFFSPLASTYVKKWGGGTLLTSPHTDFIISDYCCFTKILKHEENSVTDTN
jgi:hypothetical protein